MTMMFYFLNFLNVCTRQKVNVQLIVETCDNLRNFVVTWEQEQVGTLWLIAL